MKPTLEDLCPLFLPAAQAAMADVTARGYRLCLVTVLRSQLEEAEAVEQGRSQTMNSHHLPQVNCPRCGTVTNSAGTLGLSHAIDVAPFMSGGSGELDWDDAHPAWQAIGDAAHAHGLTWGGTWTSLVDKSHLQLTGPYLGPTEDSNVV